MHSNLPPPPSDWTQDRIDLLVKLWTVDLLTATQVGAIMGITKNAVLGKVHRMKLPHRKAPSTNITWHPALSADALARREQLKVQDRLRHRERREIMKKLKGPAPVARAKPQPPEPDVDLAVLKAPAWQPIPGARQLDLMQVTDQTCRWPLGETVPFRFCGCETVPGSRYCDVHKVRAAGVGTISEREAHRLKKAHVEARA